MLITAPITTDYIIPHWLFFFNFLPSFMPDHKPFVMIQSSELIINNDGSIFHLHLRPEQIANDIILVGDPGRIDLIASFMDRTEFRVQNREFVSVTGTYKNKRITLVSTGIGTDNIDIVLNELDALANINLETREIKPVHRSLNIIRIGTSGGLQDYLPVNSFVVQKKPSGSTGYSISTQGETGFPTSLWRRLLKAIPAGTRC